MSKGHLLVKTYRASLPCPIILTSSTLVTLTATPSAAIIFYCNLLNFRKFSLACVFIINIVNLYKKSLAG